MIATTIPQWLAATVPPDRSTPRTDDQRQFTEMAQIPVLVIEDEAMIAWMLESLLEDMGFQLITLAWDAAEAVAAAERQPPGLILSDINLGQGADGVEAVGTIRRTCDAAVLFVSAYIDENARSRIAEQVVGAWILPKPLDSDRLAAGIRDAFGLNRMQ